MDDWPRNGELRYSLSGRRSSRSRSRPDRLQLRTMDNRTPREPRLSTGSIRDFERQTSDVPTMLRNNIHNIIAEIRPFVERARYSESSPNGGGAIFHSWLNSRGETATIPMPRDYVRDSRDYSRDPRDSRDYSGDPRDSRDSRDYSRDPRDSQDSPSHYDDPDMNIHEYIRSIRDCPHPLTSQNVLPPRDPHDHRNFRDPRDPHDAQFPRDSISSTTSPDSVVINMELSEATSSPSSSPVQPPDDPSPAGSSEHSNSGSNNTAEDADDHPSIDVADSLLLRVMYRYFPFFALITGKFIFDHVSGILIFIMLMFAFYYYNVLVRREVARQGFPNFRALFIFIIHFVVLIIGVAFAIYSDMTLNLCFGIVPQSEYPLALSDLLWSVIVTDFILKLITITIKALFTMLPERFINFSKRGRFYLFIEATSQLYRACVPIQPWLHYLLESYKGPKKVAAVFLSAAYMASKGNSLLNSFQFWWISLVKLIRNVSLGTTPTKDQVSNIGNVCSICHDEFKTPILLECTHIFCELCVTKWLDREPTCPLCRAKITDDPSWKDGSTTLFIQVY